jgi:putative membrane protein
MMIWYGDATNWWAYAGMGIGMVVFWTLVVGGIFVLVRLTAVDIPHPPQPPLSP